MKELTVSEVSRLTWGSAVPEVVGVIAVIHPPLRGAGWSLQNGELTDSKSGAKIEFMLSKHKSYLEPHMVGRTVRFASRASDDMIWKEQKAKPNVNNGRPFAKLEILPTAVMEFVQDTPSLFDRPAAQEPAAPQSAEHKSQPPAPFVPLAGKGGTEGVRGEIRRMMALYALTKHEVKTSPFMTSDAPTEEVMWRLFAAGCLNGLHNQLDPEKVLFDVDPDAAAKLRPKFTELMSLNMDKDAMLCILRGSGIIGMTHELKDMSEQQAEEGLKKVLPMIVQRAS